MADTKISLLTQVTTPTAADNFYIDDGGVSKRIEASDLKAYCQDGLTGLSAENVIITVRKSTAGTITKGAPVYLVGYNASGYYTVEVADADDAAKMPAVGIAGENITNSANSELVLVGTLSGMDTSAWSVGDNLYVGDASTLVNTRPANADDAVQKVGTVSRSNASQGVILVVGALRSNDQPNTHPDNIFRIVDNGDSTKAVQFQASGITTGTTRTLTVPDADITIGNVSNTGTPVNDQIAVWTSATAVEGSANLTYSSTQFKAGNFVFNTDQTVGAGQDNYVLTYDQASGEIGLEASAGGGGSAGKQTIWVPASAMRPTVSNGCSVLTDVETTSGRPDMQVLDFDGAVDEHAQFQVAMPKQWNESTVTFQAFWTTTATDTDGVAWALQGVACGDGDTIDAAYGTAVVVTDAGQSTAEDMYVTSESSAITIAGTPAEGDVCFFRIFRDVSDAADTATEDARLIGVKLLWTQSTTNDD